MATTLPDIIAGPMIRHCQPRQTNFWLVTSQDLPLRLILSSQNQAEPLFDQALDNQQHQIIQIGDKAFINLISVNYSQPLPENIEISYDFLQLSAENPTSILQPITGLTYNNRSLPNFIIRSDIQSLLHGSCRKPHFASEDGLVQVDNKIKQSLNEKTTRPSLLIMSGDQVYCDDVAGPMLSAILQVIQLLGLYEENNLVDGQTYTFNNQGLAQSDSCFYLREDLLPKHEQKNSLLETLVNGVPNPIFSSVNAHNHLITVSEVLAMYLLVWSPTLWPLLDIEQEDNVAKTHRAQYQNELTHIKDFAASLPQVRRALAHIPTYMIFDDHDITDDWNLTRAWETAAYNNAFSKRIIGNALIGYYLCQGWGNAPDNFSAITPQVKASFSKGNISQQDVLINQLFECQHWHYQLDTNPKIVVLDTRTQRWRSESNANKPSGLMDWESLCALQLELINQPSVIMVSAAPIYGVKLIETIQRIFTFIGKPLVVDAENWMAHSGTANVMLNIFRHKNTPPNFIILSGDVHYSFVYKVTHRFIRNSSTILQVTCSGIKNQFPSKLLHILEKFNRYLYAAYSPLNWFTKRRRMRVKVKKPSDSSYKTLYNGSGIGLLTLDEQKNAKAEVLTAENKIISFD